MKHLNFGPERFEEWAKGKPDTYAIAELCGDVEVLLDHGFIADRACVWSDELKGHEIAIISRTYAEDDIIDNPPVGLKCIRLPPEVMGAKDLGAAIATVITGPTKSAEFFLRACLRLPVDMLAYAIHQDMQFCYAIALETDGIRVTPRIVETERMRNLSGDG